MPANRALASVSELRAVQGMTAVVYQALAPLVTVWPESGATVNILTCPLPVLRALNADDQLVPMAPLEAERIDALRREAVFASVEDFLADPALEGQPLRDLEPLLDIRSDWFVLDAAVELAERERRLSTVLRRSPSRCSLFFVQRASYDDEPPFIYDPADLACPPDEHGKREHSEIRGGAAVLLRPRHAPAALDLDAQPLPENAVVALPADRVRSLTVQVSLMRSNISGRRYPSCWKSRYLTTWMPYISPTKNWTMRTTRWR